VSRKEQTLKVLLKTTTSLRDEIKKLEKDMESVLGTKREELEMYQSLLDQSEEAFEALQS
jgi:cell division protein FtsB